MENAEGQKISVCFTEKAIVQLITKTMFGKPVVENETYAKYITQFSTLPKKGVEKTGFNSIKQMASWLLPGFCINTITAGT